MNRRLRDFLISQRQLGPALSSARRGVYARYD